MKLYGKRGRFVLSAVMIGLGLGVPALPGTAGATDVCAGEGYAYVPSPHDPASIEATSTWFTATLDVSACAVGGGTLSLSGPLTGTCATTTGWGYTSHGHFFTLTGELYNFVLTGAAVGTMHFVSGDLVPAPCRPLSWGNRQFVVVGEVVEVG